MYSTISAQGVVDIIPAPDYAYGLTHDGTALWVGSGNDLKIWKIDDHSGARLDSIVPATDETRGLGWDGGYLWGYQYIFGSSNPLKKDMIVKYANDGTMVDTLASPYEDYIGGMCWADGYLWISVYYPQTPTAVLVKIDPLTGAFVDTLPSPGQQPQGLAFDGTHLWLAMDDNDGDPERIWQLDAATGDTLSSFPIPPYHSSTTARPRDMAWDGQFLYLVVGSTFDKAIYKIDIGAGGTPQIGFSTDELQFGDVAINAFKSLPLIIYNTGTGTLTVDSLVVDQPEFAVTGITFPQEISPDSSIAVSIEFSPETWGVVQGSLQVHSNDVAYPVENVSLTGMGLYAEPTISTGASQLDFGQVWIPGKGNSRRYLSIANLSVQPLQISGLLTSTPYFTTGSPEIPFSINSNDTIQIVVRFEPQAAQNYSDTLQIHSNDGGNPLITVELTGSGSLDSYTYGYQFWNYSVPTNPRTGYQDPRIEGLNFINDITGDGLSEVLVATDNYWLLCLDGASGGTADTLWAFNSYINNFNAGSIGQTFDFGVQDALDVASDLNGDGKNDVVIGTGGGNEHVYAIDGTKGTVIWEYGDNINYAKGDFEAVDVQRDFNGDSVPDVLAIADGTEDGGGYHRAFCFNGLNGSLLWQYVYPGPDLSFGKTIISIDDINGDNKPDAVIAVGNNGDTDLKVYALDGATGFPIWDFPTTTYEPKELLELPVQGQSPDIIAAEYFGRIFRIDGETGVMLWDYNLGGFSGVIQIDLLRDITGDGISEILIASFANGLTCLNGDNGYLVWTYPMANQYGVTAVPDLNNDGVDDVFTGDQNGTVYCISGHGNDLLFSFTFTDDPINAVSLLPSIDGNASFELTAGTRNGNIVCFSGGLNAVNNADFNDQSVPNEFALQQNYPNPFNPVTEIRFNLTQSSEVKLVVFNALGQVISDLINNKRMTAGVHSIQFDGKELPSGIYFYRLETNRFTQTRKMVLLR